MALGYRKEQSQYSLFGMQQEPINIMKLLTKFSEGKIDKAEDKDFDSADI